MGLKKPAAKAAQEVEVKKAKIVEEVEQEEQETAEPEEVEVEEPEDEVEPDEAEAEEEDEEPSKEVAVTESKAVARKTGTATPIIGGGKFEDEMAKEGFEGLESSFYSYTTVKLPAEGVFETSDGEEVGKEIFVTLLGSKAKYAYSHADDDETVEFSNDGVHNIKGVLLEDIFNEWRDEAGDDKLKIERKHYLDVTAMVSQEGHPLDGEIIVLSVSPSGVAKFTGYIGKLKYRGINPREVLTKVYVGAKVTTVKKPFYPWAFKPADQ